MKMFFSSPQTPLSGTDLAGTRLSVTDLAGTPLSETDEKTAKESTKVIRMETATWHTLAF